MSLASQSSHSWQTHTFAEKNGIEIQLDYLPALIQEGVKTPFFFLIHGGAFVSGDRKTWSPWM
jgi:acetyl esterase/lipase